MTTVKRSIVSDPNRSKLADPAVDSGRDYAHELSIDPEVHDLVRKKARRLGKAFGLDHQEREDLEQDLLLRLLKALVRYDPAEGKLIAFAHGVSDRWYLAKTRALGRAGRRAQTGLLGDSDHIIESEEPPPGYLNGARAEAADVLDVLPPDLAEIARAVTRDPVAVVAERMGLHRGTVHRKLAQAKAITKGERVGGPPRKTRKSRDKGKGAAEGSG